MAPQSKSPANFRAAADRFANELRASFSSTIPAQPEDQLKGPVQSLIRAVTANVMTRTEAQVQDLGGRPDIGVSVQGALCGYVELKQPGIGARTERFSGRDKLQWEKFKALPNVIYTDSIEWALYRFGKRQPLDSPVVIRIGDIVQHGAVALGDAALEELKSLLFDFLSWEPIVPTTAPVLAQMLAPVCRLLRTEVLAAVGREDSALHRLSDEIREYLFPHVTDAEFADIYAQTLTYALLLARLSGETDLSTSRAADKLDSGHGLLAETLRVLTYRTARAEIEMPISLLERIIGAVDPERLARRGDPWLYFYEDFLAAYDPELRKRYGVYYTPREVIQCQVHLAADLLSGRFGKDLTFADEGVVFLDSSAGTAAYPIAAIESALKRVDDRYGPGMTPAMATRCAQNVYGFELLVGPYAVAHLRLTNLLEAAGASLPDDGIHMYLTDTLESPHTDPPQPPLMAERLTAEQRRARRVKEQVPVFVCMGNPPYFREEAEEDELRTRGKWVRFGDPNVPGEKPILKDFTELAGRDAKSLYNLYVYFWRWTLWKMFENPHASGAGIVSLITASSYLRGPGFVGMRQKLRESFDDLWILDLEGDNLGARKTENVFDIQTPVCIAIGVRYDRQKHNTLAKVHYSRLTGTRQEKYARLMEIRSFADAKWRDCLADAQDLLWPVPPAGWSRSPLLSNLWPWQHSGVQWKRSWPIGETREVLVKRWSALVNAAPEERGELMHETAARRATSRGESLGSHPTALPTIDSLRSDAVPLAPRRYSYRSLDRRWVLPDSRFCDRPRPSLWAAHSERQLYLTSLLTGVLGKGPAAIASAHVPDLHHFRGSFGGKDVIPLWRDAECTKPNLPSNLLQVLGGVLGPVAAEDFFAYTYSVISASAYVETFWDELEAPGPRLPITRDPRLFQQSVASGRRLLWLHTYGERLVPEGHQINQIPAGVARCTRSIPTTRAEYPDSVSFNGSCLRVGKGEFSPVAAAVWGFSVSDFFVVQSWVKSRLRDRTGRRSSALDKIRPEQWIAAMTQELLELLWIVEATVAAQTELNTLLADILAGPLFAATDLPLPTTEECQPPEEDDRRQGRLIT